MFLSVGHKVVWTCLNNMSSFNKDNALIPMTKEEEEIDRKKRHAEAQRRYRENKGNKKRSEMSSEEKNWRRLLDRESQRKRRANMTKEQKDAIRAKDRERKPKKGRKKGNIDCKEKQTGRQQKNNCRIQRKIRENRTEEEKEKVNADIAAKKREMRSDFTRRGKYLARKQAREGMRFCRKFGYLQRYKQRKCRDDRDPTEFRWFAVDKHGFSTWNSYYQRRQKSGRFLRTFRKSNDRKREMNRKRVQKHRQKVKKMLEEPVIIQDYGKKSDYELLRDKNIEELKRLKKESGLFD